MAKRKKTSGRLSDQKVRQRVFDIIQISNVSDFQSKIFDIVLAAAIILNILAMCLRTFSVYERYPTLINSLEIITALFFCVEYALRIWTSGFLYPEKSHGEAVLRFLFSYDGIVELFTILPFFYLDGFVVFRLLRVVRIFHLFRINAYYDSFNVIKNVIIEKKNQIASSVFIILILMLASSLCIYAIEHDAQPDAFKNAFSGIWWSVSTLFTVGYGDIYPITTLGKITGIIIQFLGVGVVAIPTGIISAGFVEQYTKIQNTENAALIDLLTVVVDIDSKWLNKSVKEAERESGYEIVFVKRRKKTLRPEKEFIIELKDILVVYKGA